MRDQILVGDCVQQLASLPPDVVQTCVTSPPYWGLRDYGIHGEPGAVGLEESLDDHLDAMVKVFREVRRVLRPDGTVWMNYGDAYMTSPPGSGPSKSSKLTNPDRQAGLANGFRAKKVQGLKQKDLLGLPWRVAFALQDDGWYLRSDIIWHKPNPMPESVTDRPTKAHEYLFLLAANGDYFYDAEAIKEKASEKTNSRGKGGSSPKGMLWPAIGEKHRNAGRHVHSGVPMKATVRPRQNESFQAATSAAVLPYRNKRSVWTVPTQPTSEAHFATFPEALVEPCILAGSSATGQCPSCGAPWTRDVEATHETLREAGAWTWRQQADAGMNRSGAMSKHGAARKHTTTTGWQPGCECAAVDPPLPQIVLDPFLGSGTTALTAKRLGRDFIGCELNPAYAEIAVRRIAPAMNHRLADYDGEAVDA